MRAAKAGAGEPAARDVRAARVADEPAAKAVRVARAEQAGLDARAGLVAAAVSRRAADSTTLTVAGPNVPTAIRALPKPAGRPAGALSDERRQLHRRRAGPLQTAA